MTAEKTESVAVYNPQADILSQTGGMSAAIAKIEGFQRLVQSQLKEGRDYGKIPGTQKKSLLLPGAQKLALITGTAQHYSVLDAVNDFATPDGVPFMSYRVSCQIVFNGQVIAEGVGSANTRETKYARTIRNANPASGETQIEAAVSRAADLDNTVFKMAAKRAFIGGIQQIGSLSDIFDADLGDETVPPERRKADDAAIDDNKKIEAREVKLILAKRDELIDAGALTEADFNERLKTAFSTSLIKDLTRRQGRQLKLKLEHMADEARDKDAMPSPASGAAAAAAPDAAQSANPTDEAAPDVPPVELGDEIAF